jgi:threonine/homoserine/homoserine lactone efflux protein
VPDATRSRRRDDGTVTLGAAVLSFAIVAGVLTVTPGLDTALVLRAALTRGRRAAVATAAGIIAVGVVRPAHRPVRRAQPPAAPAGDRPGDRRLTGVTLVGFGVRLAFAGR